MDLKSLIASNISTHSKSDNRPSTPRPKPELPSIIGHIDHTLLKLDATVDQIKSLCREARILKFAAVCVRLEWVKLCAKFLVNTNIKIASVIDFHEGTASPNEKAYQAGWAVKDGARELDVVLNYPALKRGKGEYLVYEGVSAVRQAADEPIYDLHGEEILKDRVLVKVIIETAQLSREQIIAACTIAKEAGADFVKTSTGLNGPGANVENIRLMKAVVGEEVGVKASGGIRSVSDCMKMIEAGATRIGTSNGVGIVEEVGTLLEEETTGEESHKKASMDTPNTKENPEAAVWEDLSETGEEY